MIEAAILGSVALVVAGAVYVCTTWLGLERRRITAGDALEALDAELGKQRKAIEHMAAEFDTALRVERKRITDLETRRAAQDLARNGRPMGGRGIG